MDVDILCQRLNPAAFLPTRAYQHDAAWDLYSVQYAQVGPTSIIIDTGIACALPHDYCAVLFGRSGLASQSLTPLGWVTEEDGKIRLGGVMDAGYRGPYRIMLATLGTTTHIVRPGEAIAQMLILPRPASRIVPVEALPPSERGIRGFGSSDLPPRPALIRPDDSNPFATMDHFRPINPDVPTTGLHIIQEATTPTATDDPPPEATDATTGFQGPFSPPTDWTARIPGASALAVEKITAWYEEGHPAEMQSREQFHEAIATLITEVFTEALSHQGETPVPHIHSSNH